MKKKSFLSFHPFFHQGKVSVESTIHWKTVDCSIQDSAGKTYFSMKGVEAPEGWSQTAIEIAAAKYFRHTGKMVENSVRQIVTRVVDSICDFGLRSKYFANQSQAKIFANEMKVLLYEQRASFNSPVWFNCGLRQKYRIESEGLRFAWDSRRRRVVSLDHVYERPQVSACFIQGLDDHLEAIFELVKTEARVFKYGSGSGTNFSKLRGRNESLSVGGVSSGVLAFLEVFDRAAGSIKSGGTTRRAAKMVILDADHPEIEDFIDWKVREEKKAKILMAGGFGNEFENEAYRTVSGQNGNNSVRVTDAFMRATEEGGMWPLIARSSSHVVKEVSAATLFDRMATAAWACADPGVQFHDNINRWHTCPKDGEIRASNPCSEYMFLDDSACNLASLNLLRFLKSDGSFDLPAFRQAVRLMFYAQEILVDLASYPTELIAENSHRFRPLGLGIAGLGSFLMLKGIPYDSEEGRGWAARIMAFVTGLAYEISAEMAEQFGSFDGFKRNRSSMLKVIKQHAQSLEALDFSIQCEITESNLRSLWERVLQLGRQHGFRNAQATVIAPTGTIGLVMDAETTGIEPEYALVRSKNLSGGGSLTLVTSTLGRALENLGYSQVERERILSWARKEGSLQKCQLLVKDGCDHRAVFATALEIWPEAHLAMMAAVQPFVSGAISKTVNLPANSTPQEIAQLYLKAWKMGLKSVAVYRDSSKSSQPLEASQFPVCSECGTTTELSGSCFRCMNCGTVIGCG